MAYRLMQAEAIDLSFWSGLLSPEDCQTLIAVGQQTLRPATVTDEASGQQITIPNRSSEMSWPKREEHPILQSIAQGVAQLTGIPATHQEPLQILHYSPGGEYRPHFDGFPEGSETLSQGGNRQMTLILYLNTPASGGETAFPELGIKVAPITGGGVLFRNLDTAGLRHPLSLHAGLPVVQGEKWIATTWIRQNPYV